jgi:UDPglucose--hexose-1-phosphate uridylyltransferase
VANAFSYVMPLHQAPTDNGDYSSFHFHVELHPTASVVPEPPKYLAGTGNWRADFLSDTTAG